jgi:hypothetical protein
MIDRRGSGWRHRARRRYDHQPAPRLRFDNPALERVTVPKRLRDVNELAEILWTTRS